MNPHTFPIWNTLRTILALSIAVLCSSSVISQGTPGEDSNVHVHSRHVRTVRGQVYITLSLSINSQTARSLNTYLRTVLGPNLLSVKPVTLSSTPSPVIFGPFPALWPTTYELVFQQSPGNRNNTGSYSSIPSSVTFKLPSNQDIPDPDHQRKTFQQAEKQLLKKLRSTYLSYYPRLQRLIYLRINGEAEFDTENSLRVETEQALNEMSQKMKTLKTEHVFGSPYSGQIHVLDQLLSLFRRFYRKSIRELRGASSSDSPDSFPSMTREERIARGMASPRDLRIRFLNRLLPRFKNPSPSEREVNNLYDRYLLLLASRAQNCVQTTDTSGVKHPVTKPATADDQRKENRSILSSLNRLMYLYRDRPSLPTVQKELSRRILSLKRSLTELEEKDQMFLEKPESYSARRYLSFLLQKACNPIRKQMFPWITTLNTHISTLLTRAETLTENRSAKKPGTQCSEGFLRLTQLFNNSVQNSLNDVSSLLRRYHNKTHPALKTLLSVEVTSSEESSSSNNNQFYESSRKQFVGLSEKLKKIVQLTQDAVSLLADLQEREERTTGKVSDKTVDRLHNLQQNVQSFLPELEEHPLSDGEEK